MSGAEFFLDTNVLVTSWTGATRFKQAIARQLVSVALAERSGVINFQVVQGHCGR